MPTTAEAIGLPFEEAIAFFRQKARVPTAHWTDVWRTAHSHSFMVAGAASDALLEDFQKAIRKALSDGTTLTEFRRDFDAIVERHGWAYNGTPGWRSRIIYETNLSTAYSAGRYAQMTEPETLKAFPYWQYQHSGSSHPRLQHLAWNGLTLRADDPFWEAHYPPNGWRCGCSVRVITEGGLRRMGKSKPDTAPPTETRPWRNPHTGEVHQVPVGIDPGFDYNPGLAWKRGPRALPVKAPDLVPALPVRPTGVAAPPGPHPPPRTFPSLEEADAWLTEQGHGWASGLSDDERDALAAYKAGAGEAINAVLRGEIEDPALREAARLVEGALLRSHAPATLRTFRTIGPGAEEAIAAAKAGTVVDNPGFTSASLSEAVAEVRAQERGGDSVIEIVVPQGTRGAAYVHSVPKVDKNELELLLAPGARLRVIGRRNGRVVLEVE
jgi:hypothetical protein